ncbi:DUF3024 domain-containing protein [Sphingomonas hengshuiensis]|uniref:DUF3024 domain-containing protein n=1 Tax=Sphingomonas hengshuiensis TaxID=1609977 RepID=A0A7U4LFR2_9SPHN|nr:hypothetical protein [Sphingomonas hengshuiensis]AJP72710.1 hypothetical protein TS85_14415 [Sphingomonas hengshuiensis]
MSVAAFWKSRAETPPAHPNELDLRRIERALRNRERYRYVTPRVVASDDGYLVRSPCCSRTVDPEGGEIDVAWLRWCDGARGWELLGKDHGAGRWIADSAFARLPDLLAWLNHDPDRKFWQ